MTSNITDTEDVMTSEPRQIQGSHVLTSKLLITAVAGLALLGAARYAWDNQVAADPQCSDAAPSAFLRSETMAKIAMQCVGDIHVGAARRYALASLKRQHHNQLAMAAIGSLYDLEAKSPEADRWMQAAASLGRRDYAVNSYWVTRSLESGHPMAAARAIDGFFRSGWTSELVTDQARSLEASVRGREGLLSILRGAAPWTKYYLMDVRPLSNAQLKNRATLLLEAARLVQTNQSLEPFPTEIILPTVSELYSRKAVGTAYALRREYRPFDTTDIVNDGSFRETDLSLNSPFDWRFYHGSGLDVSIVKGNSGTRFLALQGDGSGRFRLASQTVRLLPGTYRMSIAGATHNYMGSASSLAVTLTPSVETKSSQQAMTLSFPKASHPTTTRLDITDGALFYKLELALDAANAGAGVDSQIDSVKIERVQ